MAVAGKRPGTFRKHLSQALIDHSIERAGPARALVLGAFLAAAERPVGRPARGIGLGFSIEARFAFGSARERRQRNACAKLIAALHAARAQRL